MVGEIEATIREKLQNINEVDIKKEVTDYFNLPINLRPSIGISISYDMGWQKRTIHIVLFEFIWSWIRSWVKDKENSDHDCIR